MHELSWNDFEPDAVKSRHDLYNSKQFSDVTLVTDDQTQFEAHRIILAGASKVLNKLLSVSAERSSLIFLNGVKGIELRDILRYIYLGNVSIEGNRVKEFLKVARELQIPSINERLDCQDEKPSIKKLDFLQTFPQKDILQEESFSKNGQNGLNFLQENQTKSERIDHKVTPPNDYQTIIDSNIPDTQLSLEETSHNISKEKEPEISIEDKQETVGNKISKGDTFVPNDKKGETLVLKDKKDETLVPNDKKIKRRKHKNANVEKSVKRACDEPAECEVCAKKFTTLRSMQRHHKVVHELQRYDCPQCGVSCPGRDGLRGHIILKHEKKRVYCPKCSVSFAYGSGVSLRAHMEREHPLPACDFHNIKFQTIEEFDLHIQVEHVNKVWN